MSCGLLPAVSMRSLCLSLSLSTSLSCCFTDEHERSAVLILPDLANIPPFTTVVSSSLQPRVNLLQRRRRPLTVPLLLVTVLPPQNLKKKYGAKWALVTVSVDSSCCRSKWVCGVFFVWYVCVYGGGLMSRGVLHSKIASRQGATCSRMLSNSQAYC